MKLHDLQVGQRFTFTDKHRGKVFEVIEKNNVRTPKGRETYIIYHDVIHKNQVISHKESKTFRMEVELEQPSDRFTPDERKLLDEIFSTAYLLECDEENRAERKSAINALHLKLTGLPGRRAVLTEEE